MSRQLIDWGVAVRPFPGESISGDLHLVKQVGDGILMAALDGLGHGREAMAAAETAAAILAKHAEEPLIPLVKRCHEALKQTRGVVMVVASLGLQTGILSWLGVGDVNACLFRTDAKPGLAARPLISLNGLVGHALPHLRANSAPVSPGDLLVFVTDGIGAGFAEGLVCSDPPQQIADRIMERHFRNTDDALVLVVRDLDIRCEQSPRTTGAKL